MAPRAKAKTPREQLEAVQGLIEEKEDERDKAQTALSNAYDLLEITETGPNIAHPGPPRPPADGSLTIPERLRAAKRLEELGRDHHESLAEIRATADELHSLIGTCRETIEDKTGAIDTLGDELKALKAKYHDHLVAEAEEGSRESYAEMDALLERFDRAVAVLNDRSSRWSLLGIPIATRGDMAHVRKELAEAQRQGCWPAKCGTEEKWQARKAREQGQPRARLSNREAIAEFEGRAA
jgi:hypothetical protein